MAKKTIEITCYKRINTNRTAKEKNSIETQAVPTSPIGETQGRIKSVVHEAPRKIKFYLIQNRRYEKTCPKEKIRETADYLSKEKALKGKRRRAPQKRINLV